MRDRSPWRTANHPPALDHAVPPDPTVSPAGAPERRGRFIGRRRELTELAEALDLACDSTGSLLLISGEPGIGKSRLARELADEAARRDVLVAWGRSWQSSTVPPFWPWVQLLRSLSRDSWSGCEVSPADATRLAERILRTLSPPPKAEFSTFARDEDRLGLFEEVTSFLRILSHARPTLLVLDDLHDVDQASLRLLEFVARERVASLLVVGLYREVEAREETLSTTLASLSREGRTIPLRGLDTEEVRLFIEDLTGSVADVELAGVLRRRTGGNPYFLDEIVRLLVAEGRLGDRGSQPLPDRIREAIGQRLESIPEETRKDLEIAAVIGSRFESARIASVAGVAISSVERRLSKAIVAGFVRDDSTAPGWYQFEHDLVREVLYTGVARAERARLHRGVAESIESEAGIDRGERVVELANHWLEAIPAGGGGRAVTCLRAAGDQAMDRLAWEDAVGFYDRALSALGRSDAGDDVRCELVLALGGAQAAAGERQESRESHRQAADLARRLGRGKDLARAARGVATGFAWSEFGSSDPEAIDLLQEALRMNARAKTREERALRANLHSELAWEVYWAGETAHAEELASQGLELARVSQDPVARSVALLCRHLVLRGHNAAEERLRLTAEIERFAAMAGNRAFVLRAILLRAGDLLELGDVFGADREMASYAARARRLRQPFFLWTMSYWQATRAILDGDFPLAFARAREAHEMGRRVQPGNSLQVFALQSYLLLTLTGRFEGPETTLPEFVERYPHNPSWRCGLAQSYAMMGLEAEARRELELLAADDFRRIPRTAARTMALSLLGRVAIVLGDRDRAARIYELLLPFATRNLVVGPGLVCHGPIAYQLGSLALATGRPDVAEQHLRDAVVRSEQSGMRPWAALSRAALSGALASQPESRGEVRQLAEAALAAAREMGMTPLVGRLVHAREEAGQETPAPEPACVRFRRNGATWKVGSVRLPDSKGLRYIAHLLSHPEVEVHVLDLVPLALGKGSGSLREAGAGPALDEKAKSAYRRRLEELRADLDEAERCNDPERATQFRAELEWITREIARAVGIGGRDRSAGSSSAQRARVSVRKAIQAALARIRENDPSLAFSLEASIRTGVFCAYRPNPGNPVEWDL